MNKAIARYMKAVKDRGNREWSTRDARADFPQFPLLTKAYVCVWRGVGVTQTPVEASPYSP